MKKYILLLMPLMAFAAPEVQESQVTGLTDLSWALNDLAAKLAVPSEGVRDLDVEAIVVQLAPIRTAKMIQSYLDDLGKKQRDDKKQYARALLVALKNYTTSGKMQAEDEPSIAKAVEAALGVDLLKIATAFDILTAINASQERIYSLFASAYQSRVNTILNDPNIKNRMLPKGLRDDIAQAKKIHSVLRQIAEQSNDLLAKNFIDKIDALKQKLDGLQS